MLSCYQIEVLQAEVTALKTLVITSTPSMPNKHLHPQLANSSDGCKPQEFVKCHRRSTSHHNFTKEMKSWEPSVQTAFDPRKQDTCIKEVGKLLSNLKEAVKGSPALYRLTKLHFVLKGGFGLTAKDHMFNPFKKV